MFSSTASSSSDVPTYDFEENAHKWKKVFTASIEKMLVHVHPSLNAKDDALDYLEGLMLRLLAALCAPPAPHTVQEVEERVLCIFPNPINRWAIGDAQAAVEKTKKKSPLMLPSERIHPLLKDALQSKIDMQVTVYTLAIIEYISVDILRLAGIYVKDINSEEVTMSDIRTAMCADQVLQVLMDMLSKSESGEAPKNHVVEEAPTKGETSLTYDQLVKDLIEHEKSYIRELNMIIKVFRKKLLQIPSIRDCHRKTVDEIFSNICEVYDFSVNLLGSLEDTIEVTKENESPAIGSCFEELAEGEEFHVYLRYCLDVVPSDRCQTLVQSLLKHPEVWDALNQTSHGDGFRDAVLYYLPRLLHVPILHIFSYAKYIEELKMRAEEVSDVSNMEILEQVKGLLMPLFSQLETIVNDPDTSPPHLKKRITTEVFMRACCQMRRQAALSKLYELQRSIEGWEGKDIVQCCNHLVMEGDLRLGYSGKKQSERHLFLFDGIIVLCKQKVGGYRFKEKYLMKYVDIIDRDNTEDVQHGFEIQVHGQHGQQSTVLLLAKNAEDKNNWMASLVMISRRSTLERFLDNLLADEEKQHPLRLPDPAIYPFSVADSEENIIIEERDNSATPLIKGATLPKLIERLTYHMYASPMFVRTFLTTYRSFCTPTELLELLKKRFAIPEPELKHSEETAAAVTENGVSVGSHDSNDDPEQQDNAIMLQHREDLKRFRKEYAQPVQFRVLNVLRHWVDYHFYDFERDGELLENLTQFLESVQGKSMRKWVDSITKIILRKCKEEQREILVTVNRTPPSPKYHLRLDEKEWQAVLPAIAGGNTSSGDLVRPLLMLHPIEIARQLTLLEFDLYRSVKPSELVGNAWTKSDKETRSPNLLKMIHHTNNVTRWVMRCIIDCENFEERVAAMSRVVEIMIMFYDLNNFSGLFEMSSALESASVHRLELTKAEVKRRLPPGQKNVYEEAMELGKNHCKKYLEKLRSINPPCVPFFGMYLTNIMHIEVGNLDSLLPHNLVNFSKRRKVAEITGEIQQYQNQAYCLQVEPSIRHFLETLNPFEGLQDGEINNYLYNKSTEIEPRNIKKHINKERRWPHLSLKSPGIKTRTSRTVPNPLPNIFYPRDSNTDGGDDTPHLLTPPTPSTPCTPPANTTPTASTATTTAAANNNNNNMTSSAVATGGISSSISTGVAAGSLSHAPVMPQSHGGGSTLPHGSSMSHSSSLSLSSSSTLTLASVSNITSNNCNTSLSGTLPHSFRQDRRDDQRNSVFARVEIGGPIGSSRSSLSIGSEGLVSLSLASSSCLPPGPQTPGLLPPAGAGTIPPPLPPRTAPRRREPSLGDTSPKVQQAPDAPELPPRDPSPPPIPPRSNTLPHKQHQHPPPAPTLTPAANTSALPPHFTHFPYTAGPNSAALSSTPALHSSSTSTAATVHIPASSLSSASHSNFALKGSSHHPPPPPPSHLLHHHPPPPPPPHHHLLHHRVAAPPHNSSSCSSAMSHPPLSAASLHSLQHSSLSHQQQNSNQHATQQLPISSHQLPINSHQLPISSHQLPLSSHQLPINSHQLIGSGTQQSLSEAASQGGGSTRRRNNSIDLTMAAPPLSRRHTTNGPPHGELNNSNSGDGPPTPPPRLQPPPATRPTSSFTYDVHQQQL